MLKTITITRPDDWHVHLRNGNALNTTVAATAQNFARALIMPNLKIPITSVELADAYRQAILDNIPRGCDFQPFMTLYLTDNTDASTLMQAQEHPYILGCKLYPANATTNSAAGVSDITAIYPALAVMEKLDLVLQIHGEITDQNVDVFDREKYFIDRILEPLVKNFPTLRIVLEHITTREAVEFITSASKNIAATITAHHLLLNRNDLFKGGIRPHHYCLPILKRSAHQSALIKAATSGNSQFFLGTDSAPHLQALKENSCGCAGVYTAHAAIELYAEVFAAENALDKLEAFASFYGADFYRLPHTTTTLTLVKQAWRIPDYYLLDGQPLIPFRAGENVEWAIS